jgi:hypothetical protein
MHVLCLNNLWLSDVALHGQQLLIPEHPMLTLNNSTHDFGINFKKKSEKRMFCLPGN